MRLCLGLVPALQAGLFHVGAYPERRRSTGLLWAKSSQAVGLKCKDKGQESEQIPKPVESEQLKCQKTRTSKPMDMEKLVALCRRKGFIFQSSEIYGGINGFWDYGPLGVLLKRNIKDAWWQDMVMNPPPGPDGQEIQM